MWIFEKILITPVILYCMLAFHKLQKGSRALASGRLSEKLDMKYLIWDFKEHGENLNHIGQGMSRAVEARLKSERMKTELITNVSHDLKTPLTSVINYARLLGEEAERSGENSRMKEYSEVLLRQAERLKKLLDDLVEASKATTGNMEINMVPCELGVLLTQAAGEYEEKFAVKRLKLKIVKPEEKVCILADGRHLWRIFDNLLNNICKYAQEDSRVYLNMEVWEDNGDENEAENRADNGGNSRVSTLGQDEINGQTGGTSAENLNWTGSWNRNGEGSSGRRAVIVFRNISKYELNVSAQELEERFVRGDSSRHMEGSGLGLSIAKSLAELQNGSLRVVTDGDLFKVSLRLPR